MMTQDKKKIRWPDGIKYPYAEAMAVAEGLCAALKPFCSRIIIAGSLRRKKPMVGDVEILYIPETETRPDPKDFFKLERVNLVDELLLSLERGDVIERRKNKNGSESYGAKNKLMRHVETGIPVDFFSTTEECWHNYLVCRTGPPASNIAICEAALRKCCKWNPYGPGFTGRNFETIEMHSEAEVFEFVGLPHLPPEKRV